MNLLLDTHAWIFAATRSERLTDAARQALCDGGNRLFLSSISVWEAVLLAQRGRLGLVREPLDWVREVLRRVPAAQLPITHDIAIRSRNLDGYPGNDPADRFLIATALEHCLTLVTADEQIRRHAGIPICW